MSMKPAVLDLGEKTRVLVTRAAGREAGRRSVELLDHADSLILGFWSVEVASSPFLDELLRAVNSVTMGGDSGRLVVVAGMNEDVRESFAIVLEHRGGVMGELADHQVKLLGGTQQLKATLTEAQKQATFTAPELAERLAIKLPNLHARLKALAEAGTVARDVDANESRPRRGGGVRPYRSANVEVLEAAACDAAE